MEELLKVENLSFAYEEKEVLKNINFQIHKGEKIVFMGANGTGKSTLFLNLNGVLRPSRGKIYLEGTQVKKKDFRNLYQKVGFVFQNPDQQMIASTVKAEISFGPMNQGLSREKILEKVESSMQYLDLKKLEERPPWYLSGGEKKRVSIADVLAMDTEILIFDEPMSALDIVNVRNVEEILNRLHEDGKTLIIATHDVDFAYRFANRILILQDGELIADGQPKEIFRNKMILDRAKLQKPIIMEIWDLLLEKQVVQNDKINPLTVNELLKLL